MFTSSDVCLATNGALPDGGVELASGLVTERCRMGRSPSIDARGDLGGRDNPGLSGRDGISCNDGTDKLEFIGRSPGDGGAMIPSVLSRREKPNIDLNKDDRGRVSTGVYVPEAAYPSSDLLYNSARVAHQTW